MAALKRALLSCYDKTGLDVFAKALAQRGVELIASGGTATYLQQQGLRVKSVAAFTGSSEQLEGRVKTLHPKIYTGILAKRDDPTHMQAVGADGVIDLVVVNLYPFEETIRTPGVSLEEALEQIDIGGVALLRAAAKNFRHVTVLSSPEQYEELVRALDSHLGAPSEEFRRTLAAQAFRLTNDYDRMIAAYLMPSKELGALPATWTFQATLKQALRYGENPHQHGGWYVPPAEPARGLTSVAQLQGSELSYNNVLDVDAAVRCLLDWPEPACVIIKHASLCGAAAAPSIHKAYQRAYACDAESAFGGIVGLNRPLDAATATQLASTFLEVVVAPSVESEAKVIVEKKTKLRVVTLDVARAAAALERGEAAWQWRSVLGGWLVQEPDREPPAAAASAKIATTRSPTPAQTNDLHVAWWLAKHVRSNAIALVKDGATVGIGQGQPSRVRAVRHALAHAGERAKGAALASDGFFPFPDSVKLAAQAGVAAIIQPGGSIKDQDVIAAANTAGIAMLLTRMRHFRH